MDGLRYDGGLFASISTNWRRFIIANTTQPSSDMVLLLCDLIRKKKLAGIRSYANALLETWKDHGRNFAESPGLPTKIV